MPTSDQCYSKALLHLAFLNLCLNCYKQCCGAGPFLLQVFFSPAPAPIKSRLWTIEIFLTTYGTYLLTSKKFIYF